MNTINLKFLTGCVAVLTLLCAFALCGCSGAENDISALECFAGSCDDEDEERDHDHNHDNSYDYNYSSNYDDFFYYSSSEKSSSSKEIPQDCDLYAFGDASQFQCGAKNEGETMFNEYSLTIYSCEYVETFGLHSWVAHPDLKNCGEYEGPKNSGKEQQSNGEESSSSVSSSSSSPYLLSDSSPVACGDLWCGPQGDYSVTTGFDDGSWTSGIWDTFDDSNEGGSSLILFPANRGNGVNTRALDNIIDECNGGICGIANLSKNGSGIPYTGLYFNLVNNKMDGANITDWGGICITYQTTGDVPIMIELVPEGYPLTDSEADNYVAPLDPKETKANIPWSSFVQENGGFLYLFQQDLFLTQVAAIKIVMKGSSGASGAFRITSIGKYNSCK